jgi:putative SOS response-associated peptidase YedK
MVPQDELMCGRFSLGVDTDRLIGEFGLDDVPVDHEPRYNVAPGQDVLAVVRGPEGLRTGLLRWGLVPHWAPDPKGGGRLINARSETVATRPSFRDAFRHRRCWILADGFYEWAPTPWGRKQPHFIRRPDGRPFALAGLWDRWRRGEDQVVSCTILTTSPSDVVAPLHDRMPVILPAAGRDRWLDPSAEFEDLHALLRPDTGPLEAFPVATLVNHPDNDGPEVRAPVATGEGAGNAAGETAGESAGAGD